MNKKILGAILLVTALAGCSDTGACPVGYTCVSNNSPQANAVQVNNTPKDFGLYGPVDFNEQTGGEMQKIGYIGKCQVYRIELYYEHIVTICPHQKTTDVQNTIRSGKQIVPNNDEEVQ